MDICQNSKMAARRTYCQQHLTTTTHYLRPASHNNTHSDYAAIYKFKFLLVILLTYLASKHCRDAANERPNYSHQILYFNFRPYCETSIAMAPAFFDQTAMHVHIVLSSAPLNGYKRAILGFVTRNSRVQPS